MARAVAGRGDKHQVETGLVAEPGPARPFTGPKSVPASHPSARVAPGDRPIPEWNRRRSHRNVGRRSRRRRSVGLQAGAGWNDELDPTHANHAGDDDGAHNVHGRGAAAPCRSDRSGTRSTELAVESRLAQTPPLAVGGRPSLRGFLQPERPRRGGGLPDFTRLSAQGHLEGTASLRAFPAAQRMSGRSCRERDWSSKNGALRRDTAVAKL